MLREVRVVDGIPPLAWLVETGRVPRIVVGTCVELQERDGRLRATEGAWEGDFASDVTEARHLFGSGFVAGEDEMVFCAASHTLEALYVHRNGARTVVSNSLAFLVRHGGLALDPAVSLNRSAHSMMAGLATYDRLIHRSGDDRIFRHAYCNLRVRDGEVEAFDRPLPPRFHDFAGYRDYMLGVLRGLRANAAAPERRRAYGLVTSVSSGYDSTACAALAAAVGCDGAITIRSARGDDLDTGRPVAEALGIPCIERDRAVVAAADGRFVEAEFIASFDSGDSVFATFADVLPGNLVLTGHHGDAIWNLQKPADDDISRLDPSGMGLHEFRLRTGFVTVPLAFVAARRHGDIRAISQSDEMRPFRIGGDYDRPVPRRIAEEAGIPRALFGQSKKAVNVNLWHAERRATEPTRRDIAAFVAARTGLVFRARERMFMTVQFLLDLTSGYVETRVGRPFLRIGFLRRRARRMKRKFERRWSTLYRAYQNHVTIWALTRVGDGYAAACEARPGAAPPPGERAAARRRSRLPRIPPSHMEAGGTP